METMEHRPDSKGEARTVESVLQTVTQDLKRLHQGLITQLAQEVNQLQAEKARLTTEVQTLQAQQHQLQTQNAQALSQQQIAQQQLWAKQLALALSNHLQGLMMQQISQTMKANGSHGANGGISMSSDSNVHSDNAHRLLASLDTTFSTTFKTLQQELNSYQSALSQQLGRMHNLEQQGEAVLEVLVNRLKEQLQVETAGQLDAMGRVAMPSAHTNGNPAQPLGLVDRFNGESGSQAQIYGQVHARSPQPLPPPPDSPPSDTHEPPRQRRQASTDPTPLAVPATPVPSKSGTKKEISNFWAGLVLVLVSTVALSIHNVVVRVIGKPSSILGAPEIGGFINITVLGNSLLILWLRMLIVVPLMVGLAMSLYPPVWRDLKKFFTSGDRRPVYNVIGSGLFLFLSQILIYIAIGQIGPGPAVTILFMYPIVTVPLAWVLFGDRPTPLRWFVMAVIFLGVFLTALPKIDPGKIAAGGGVGVPIAIGAGVAFALYLIFMQLGFKKLHPVPVSVVQFFTIFVLSAVILIAVGPNLGVQVLAQQRDGFVLSGILLGVLTLIGYLSNNFGVRFMGAGLASIIASIGPVMTALLAWLLIQDKLQTVQWSGIILVTVGVSLLSIERMQLQKARKL